MAIPIFIGSHVEFLPDPMADKYYNQAIVSDYDNSHVFSDKDLEELRQQWEREMKRQKMPTQEITVNLTEDDIKELKEDIKSQIEKYKKAGATQQDVVRQIEKRMVESVVERKFGDAEIEAIWNRIPFNILNVKDKQLVPDELTTKANDPLNLPRDLNGEWQYGNHQKGCLCDTCEKWNYKATPMTGLGKTINDYFDLVQEKNVLNGLHPWDCSCKDCRGIRVPDPTDQFWYRLVQLTASLTTVEGTTNYEWDGKETRIFHPDGTVTTNSTNLIWTWMQATGGASGATISKATVFKRNTHKDGRMREDLTALQHETWQKYAWAGTSTRDDWLTLDQIFDNATAYCKSMGQEEPWKSDLEKALEQLVLASVVIKTEK